MKRVTKYALSLMAVAALGACDNETPEPNGGNYPEGTLMLSTPGFLVGGSDFDTDPSNARSALQGSTAEQWVDEETGMLMTAHSVNQPEKEISRGFPLNSGDWQRFDNTYGPADKGIRVSAIVRINGQTKAWMHNEPVWRRANNGSWAPADNKFFWPMGESVTFYSWTPGTNVTNVRGDGKAPIITVTTPKNDFADTHQDVMVASVTRHYSDNGATTKPSSVEAPGLVFRHILAGLRVRVAVRQDNGVINRRINRFDILNIPYRSGDYNVATDQWVNKVRDTFSVWTSESGTTSGSRRRFDEKGLKPHIYNDLMEWDQTLLLIPQKLDGCTLRIFWSDNNNGTGYSYQDIKLDNVTLEAGKITYVDVQEPSIFVEQVRTFRETGGATQWNVPENDGSPYDYFRLCEGADGNYYKSNRPVKFSYVPVPASLAEENTAWQNNDRQYFGNRITFNILSRVHGGGNKFFHAADLRLNFAVQRNVVTYAYKEYDNNSPREAYHAVKGESPNDWDVSKDAAPWTALGGEIDVVLKPRKISNTEYAPDGQITFTPRSTASHPIRFPRRIVVAGSVDRVPYLDVAPRRENLDETVYKESNTNNRSFRGEANSTLRLVDDNQGIYEGTVVVNQWTPYIAAANEYRVYDSWRSESKGYGYGSVIFFASILHGGWGTEKIPADEYVSRLGVKGEMTSRPYPYECSKYQDSNEGTVGNFGFTYAGSYLKLKCGIYFMRYNITTQELYFRRTGDFLTKFGFYDYYPHAYNTWLAHWNNASLNEWKAFKKPHDNIRYFWYDVYKWNWTDWYIPHDNGNNIIVGKDRIFDRTHSGAASTED